MSLTQDKDTLLNQNYLQTWYPGTVLHHMADAVLLADAAGIVGYVNPAYEKLNRQKAQEVVGKELTELFSTYDTSDMWRTLRAGRPWQKALSSSHPDGETVESEWIITPLMNSAGHIFEFVGVQRDISHLKTAQRLSLDFAGDSLRDLYFPLTRMRVYQSLLKRGKPEKQPEYFAMIERQLVHMERMISNLTLLMRLDQLTPERLDRGAADLDSLVSQMTARFMPLARERDLTLVQELDPDLPAVLINVDLVIEALKHLVENALVFTPPGGQVTLETGTARRDDRDYVAVRVIDTGVGIPDGECASMFARRFRGAAAQEMNPDGTGLGLSIVSQIVELHRGCVEFTSPVAAGEGSAFALLFRLQP
ncbi:MAG: PAS domain-containing protein [Anaerolineae bacterium]|nr:PAS domain-containing protein [Anaerolineae bacterium]